MVYMCARVLSYFTHIAKSRINYVEQYKKSTVHNFIIATVYTCGTYASAGVADKLQTG